MEYVSDAEAGVVTEWVSEQPTKVEVKFHERLRALSQMSVDEWKDPWAKPLHGECKGLVELRFKAERVQHRPIGFFGPKRGQFTIVLCAREVGGRFEPKKACTIAQGRKNEIDDDPARARRYEAE